MLVRLDEFSHLADTVIMKITNLVRVLVMTLQAVVSIALVDPR